MIQGSRSRLNTAAALTMWPKEHGAYGQVAFPLLTSFAVAGVSVPAVLVGVAVVAAFVAHEPLLVLLGRRGARVRLEQHQRAVTWLALTTMAGAVAAGTALLMASDVLRGSLAIPLVPAMLFAAALARGQEKTTSGELAAALAFSLVAVPVGVAAEASPATAAAIAVAFALTFSTQTLAVRGVILAVRGGGNPAASRRARRTAMAIGAAGVAAIVAAAARAAIPWATAAAVTPGLLAVAWLVVAPPPPTRLRRVGWTLVATSCATSAILIGSV